MVEADERKGAKYPELVEDWRRNNWYICCETVEMCCQEFACRSLCKTFT